MNTYSYEMTDTFAGEANYCWVERGTVEAINLQSAARKARRELGWTGIRGDTSDFGDMLEWRPRAACVVLFIQRDGTPRSDETA